MASMNRMRPPARYSYVRRRRSPPSPPSVAPLASCAASGTLTICWLVCGANGSRGLKPGSGGSVVTEDACAWLTSDRKLPESAGAGGGSAGAGARVLPGAPLVGVVAPGVPAPGVVVAVVVVVVTGGPLTAAAAGL